jgi:uncharacterized protein YecE (DUF72 family)
MSCGRDVFLYFDNDMKVMAPENALELTRRLHLVVQAKADSA